MRQEKRTDKSESLVGMTFAKLKVVMDSKEKAGRTILWLCLCECGRESKVTASKLRLGRTKSCGCLRKDAPPAKTHGLSQSAEYKSWANMIQRCNNEKLSDYKNYGGRGIQVCEAWKLFENFYADMGPKPKGKYYSIDRRDNDAGYEPKNCYWATRVQQNRNTRANNKLTVNGETLCAAEWAERLGGSSSLIWLRLSLGWTIERACTQPVRGTMSQVPIECSAEDVNATDWALE